MEIRMLGGARIKLYDLIPEEIETTKNFNKGKGNQELVNMQRTVP